MIDRDREEEMPLAASRDAEFVSEVARLLRTEERLDDTFEQRLATAIRAELRVSDREMSGSGRDWWRRPRNVAISPLATLALAAGVAFIVAASTMSLSSIVRRGRGTPLSIARSAAVVHVVRFVYVDSTARSVALVGDFNGWRSTGSLLEPTGAPGVWSLSVPLAVGRHEYAFIVDGTRWVADPFARPVHDDFGTVSSIIQLTNVTPPNAS